MANTVGSCDGLVGPDQIQYITGRNPENPNFILARPITINRVVNGFYLQVGCQSVVFETQEKMLAELDRYFKSPRDVEKEYLTKGKG